MKSFKPTTPEEVYCLMIEHDCLVGKINDVVKHLYGFLTNTPVESLIGFINSKGEVGICAFS